LSIQNDSPSSGISFNQIKASRISMRTTLSSALDGAPLDK